MIEWLATKVLEVVQMSIIYIYIGACTKSLVFNFCLDSKIYMTKLHVYKCYLFTNFHFNKN